MKYKIVGLWRSGSHYLEQLMRQNFDIEYEEDMDMDNFNIHRHAHPHDMFEVFNKENNIIIVITKSYELWYESMRAKRHAWMDNGVNFQYKDEKDVSNFVPSMRIDDMTDEGLREIYDTFLEEWQEYNTKYYSAKLKHPYRIKFVKYEELITNPEAVMKDIEYFYGLKMKPFDKKVGKLKFTDKFDPTRLVREREFRHYDLKPNTDEHLQFYSIYLERRKDRFERLQTNVQRRNFKNVNVKYIASVDGTILDKEDLNEYGVTPYKHWNLVDSPPINAEKVGIDTEAQEWLDYVKGKWWNRDVTMGEIGCSLGHMGMWQRAKLDNKDINIFAEDDIWFTKNWQLKIRLALDHLDTMGKEWDMIYLGRALGVDGKPDTPFAMDSPSEVNNMVRPSFSYCLHGYIFNQGALDKVLEKLPLLKENLFITDEYIPALYYPHPREDINRMFGRDDFKCYAMIDESIKQYPKENVSDTDLGGSAI